MKLTLAKLWLAVSTLLLVSHTTAQSDDLTVQAAYHVIYSYTGTTPPAELYTLIGEGKVGGIILFSDNVNGNTSTVIESFQSTYNQSSASCGYPLLIVTDQEGGEVVRVPGGPDLSEKEIGESSNASADASTAGQQAYQALHNENINGNLAPVLDVFRQAGDFIDQYQRSYGNTSAVVGECAGPFITAQQSAGVVATAKHCPGLGAALTNQDTDERPVTINLTLSELRAVDEAPYAQAISAGIKMVMASWAFYPALDASRPSGLSQKWLQGELRQRLGFAGVTISDAIEAGGLDAFGSDDGYRAVLASQAGLDVILAAAQDQSQGEGIVTALVDNLNNGTLDRAAFDDATQRILALRSSLPL